MTPFEILGLPEDADDDAQVKQAYLAKVRAYPPERAPQQFQRVREAYETVQDRRKRLAYALFHRREVTSADVLGHLLHQRGTPRRANAAAFRQALVAALAHPPESD